MSKATLHVSTTRLDTWYHLTDHQFSTVALIDNAANLRRAGDVRRRSGGDRARHHWTADITGDGAVGVADQSAMTNTYRASIGNSAYNVDADISRTGTVNNLDLEWTTTQNFQAALPKGQLSAHGNAIGYAGYVFNAEILGGAGLYTVRFRHYDPGLGRWLERDPLGYVDGMSLYGYVRGNAVNAFDPFGLSDRPCWRLDLDDHGKPHIQNGDRRYRVNDLSPIEHKGKTPAKLNAKDLRHIIEDGIPASLRAAKLNDSIILKVLDSLKIADGVMGKLAKNGGKAILKQIAKLSPLFLLFLLADYAEGGVEQAAKNAVIPGELIEELLEIAAEEFLNWMDSRHYEVQRGRWRRAGFSEREIDELVKQLLFEEQLKRLDRINDLLRELE